MTEQAPQPDIYVRTKAWPERVLPPLQAGQISLHELLKQGGVVVRDGHGLDFDNITPKHDS